MGRDAREGGVDCREAHGLVGYAPRGGEVDARLGQVDTVEHDPFGVDVDLSEPRLLHDRDADIGAIASERDGRLLCLGVVVMHAEHCPITGRWRGVLALLLVEQGGKPHGVSSITPRLQVERELHVEVTTVGPSSETLRPTHAHYRVARRLACDVEVLCANGHRVRDKSPGQGHEDGLCPRHLGGRG